MTQVMRLGGNGVLAPESGGGGGDSSGTFVTARTTTFITGDGRSESSGGLSVEVSPFSATVWRHVLGNRGVSSELARLCRIWQRGQAIREAVCVCDGPGSEGTPRARPGCVSRGGTKGARVLGRKIGNQDPARTRTQARVLVREALRHVGASVDVSSNRVVEMANVVCGAAAAAGKIPPPDEAAIVRRAKRLCFGEGGAGSAGGDGGGGGGGGAREGLSTPVKVGLGLGAGVGGALLLRAVLG